MRCTRLGERSIDQYSRIDYFINSCCWHGYCWPPSAQGDVNLRLGQLQRSDPTMLYQHPARLTSFVAAYLWNDLFCLRLLSCRLVLAICLASVAITSVVKADQQAITGDEQMRVNLLVGGAGGLDEQTFVPVNINNGDYLFERSFQNNLVDADIRITGSADPWIRIEATVENLSSGMHCSAICRHSGKSDRQNDAYGWDEPEPRRR